MKYQWLFLMCLMLSVSSCKDDLYKEKIRQEEQELSELKARVQVEQEKLALLKDQQGALRNTFYDTKEVDQQQRVVGSLQTDVSMHASNLARLKNRWDIGRCLIWATVCTVILTVVLIIVSSGGFLAELQFVVPVILALFAIFAAVFIYWKHFPGS